MSEHFWGRAVREVALAAAAATVFCLLFEALLAVFVRAYALSSEAILLSNLLCKTAAAFAFSLLFVRRERAFFKGMAAGLLFLLVTTFLFGLIGGFRFTPLFLAGVLLGALSGGFGVGAGREMRKE